MNLNQIFRQETIAPGCRNPVLSHTRPSRLQASIFDLPRNDPARDGDAVYGIQLPGRKTLPMREECAGRKMGCFCRICGLGCLSNSRVFSVFNPFLSTTPKGRHSGTNLDLSGGRWGGPAFPESLKEGDLVSPGCC